MMTNYSITRQKVALWLPIALAGCIVLTVLLDMLESVFQQSSFYLSESFLFSSFWWLFPPLLFAQFVFRNSCHTKIRSIVLALTPAILHLLAYPALVWLISKVCYEHTFSYWQTFNYGLPKYGLLLLFVYTAALIAYALFKNKQPATASSISVVALTKQPDFITTLVVADGSKKLAIETQDILFFSANPPYINIHHKTKRYLHNDTLKSISAKLDERQFIRIHKSVIVNMAKVQSYQSRLNGDYDLTMTDGTILRLSRNYAATFKHSFANRHQDTTV